MPSCHSDRPPSDMSWRICSRVLWLWRLWRPKNSQLTRGGHTQASFSLQRRRTYTVWWWCLIIPKAYGQFIQARRDEGEQASQGGVIWAKLQRIFHLIFSADSASSNASYIGIIGPNNFFLVSNFLATSSLRTLSFSLLVPDSAIQGSRYPPPWSGRVGQEA